MRWIAALFLCVQVFSAPGQIFKSIGKIEADFKGGVREFKYLVHHEMVYPEKALKEGIEGEVGFEVVIEEDGAFKIGRQLLSVDPQIDAEARRLVSMTQYLPATMDSFPMSSYKNVYIDFNVKNYNKYVDERGYHRPPKTAFPVDSSWAIYNAGTLTQQPYPALPKGSNINAYIYKHLHYPPEAYKRNIIGRTTIEFVVEPSGNITNMHPKHHLGGGCYEEAKRVLRSLSWVPGVKDGKVVRSQMTHTIYFKLPNESNTRSLIGNTID